MERTGPPLMPSAAGIALLLPAQSLFLLPPPAKTISRHWGATESQQPFFLRSDRVSVQGSRHAQSVPAWVLLPPTAPPEIAAVAATAPGCCFRAWHPSRSPLDKVRGRVSVVPRRAAQRLVTGFGPDFSRIADATATLRLAMCVSVS
ncbi:hypothetical protein MTO96_017380 [Rhipicephalus appendiculatus]